MKILILGANSDIGTAIAARFAEREHADLCLASRNTDRLNDVAADMKIRYRVNTEVFYFDALDYASHESFYRSLETKPDGVIVAFGYMGSQNTAQSDFQESRHIFETNLLGTVSILEIIAGDFSLRKTGFIIAISSVAGLRGRKSNYIYGASKGGLLVYMEGLRHRLSGLNINVITVLPGFVRTKMTAAMTLPQLLLVNPDKVATDVYRAFKKEKSVVYTPWIWRWIMTVIRLMPRCVFHRTDL